MLVSFFKYLQWQRFVTTAWIGVGTRKPQLGDIKNGLKLLANNCEKHLIMLSQQRNNFVSGFVFL